jgi:DNA-binding transcriptional regulator GbsR (MarR family)
MSEASLSKYGQLVRLFEKQAVWLGLSRNAGPVLVLLYLAKYSSDDKISVEEICGSTKYSRSNVGMILSQLEVLGLVQSETDFGQAGPGRRRILYTVDEDMSVLVALTIKKIADRLEELMGQIDSLLTLYKSNSPHIIRLLEDLREDASENLPRISD